MANYSMKYVVSLMVWTLATPLLPLAWASDDLNSIRFGEPAWPIRPAPFSDRPHKMGS